MEFVTDKMRHPLVWDIRFHTLMELCRCIGAN
ncbi:Uncharacterised protein [Vibrio cholerae]|nr:Uncharacterised protein [Vibrio cholerae]